VLCHAGDGVGDGACGVADSGGIEEDKGSVSGEEGEEQRIPMVD
jgi:hypothetical protein